MTVGELKSELERISDDTPVKLRISEELYELDEVDDDCCAVVLNACECYDEEEL